MSATDRKPFGWLQLRQFVKFCLVGGSGVVVDMTVLYFLADPKMLAWDAIVAKIVSAEIAMLNNFFWNETWTFEKVVHSGTRGFLYRLLRFHVICGIGIGLAVFLLHMFHNWLSVNLYVANFLAILLATFWNFWMNALFNWKVDKTSIIRSARLI